VPVWCATDGWSSRGQTRPRPPFAVLAEPVGGLRTPTARHDAVDAAGGTASADPRRRRGQGGRSL